MHKTAKKVIAIAIMVVFIAATFGTITAPEVSASSSLPKVSSLKAKAGKTSVNLSWKKLTTKHQKQVSGIAIFRNGTLIIRVSNKAGSYVDSGTKRGTKYSYTVKTYKTKKKTKWFNKKTKKWQTKKPAKKNRGKSKRVTVYTYSKASNKATVTSKVIEYKITWKNWDGSVLRTGTVQKGKMPSYGRTPTRPDDNENSYKFSKWTPKVVPANGNATYTACYNIEYAQKIPILTFHRIVSDKIKAEKYKENQWVASVSDFERQMEYLYNNNYRTISLQEFEDWFEGRIKLPKKTVVLTIDDGYYDVYYLIYPVLEKYGFCATAFIVGSFTKDETVDYSENETYHHIGKDAIIAISEEYPNLQFQSHSYDLHRKTEDKTCFVNTKTYEELVADCRTMTEEFGFKYLAYPYGACNDKIIQAAANNGISMAFRSSNNRCATRKDDRYRIPRVTIDGQISYESYVKKLKSYL